MINQIFLLSGKTSPKQINNILFFLSDVFDYLIQEVESGSLFSDVLIQVKEKFMPDAVINCMESYGHNFNSLEAVYSDIVGRFEEPLNVDE